jgi:hypothetical protein
MLTQVYVVVVDYKNKWMMHGWDAESKFMNTTIAI